MKPFVLVCCLLSLEAFSQTITIAATEDSILINDTIAFSNTDIALMNLEYGIEAAVAGDYDGAISYFTAALLFDATNPQIFYNRGLAYYYLDDFETAIADFTQTLALNPSDTSALSQRGITYAQLDDNQNALADFNELLRVHPTSSLGHYNKGILFLTMELTEEACALLRKAEKLGYASATGVRSTYCD